VALAKLRVEFDPQQEFYYRVMGYEDLISNSNFYARAQIERGLASIILGVLENAIDVSGIPGQYANHLRQGFASVIIPQLNVSTNGSILYAEVPDIAQLGTVEDLVRGMHYHAIAAIASRTEFSKNNPPLIELPYTGQEMYNQKRPERRRAFWEAIVAGTVVQVEIKRRSRKEGGGMIGYTIPVSTAGMYDETLNARVATWGSTYPEWRFLEYGNAGPPAIRATHFRSMIEQSTLSFMEEAWRIQFDELVDEWNRNNVSASPYAQQQEREWERFYSSHMEETIDRYDYGYDVRGKGSKIRNLKTGRFA
jgi:hypothetical protein